MELLVNDLSFEGQFSTRTEALAALTILMRIRAFARERRRTLHCHRGMASAQMTQMHSLPEIVKGLGRDRARALMQWVSKGGPFWDEDRFHKADDWLQLDGERIVTDSALGEAAFRRLNGQDYRLVSVMPSSWEWTPITVEYVPDEGGQQRVDVPNYRTEEEIKTVLDSEPLPIESWADLADLFLTKPGRCPGLSFSPGTFSYLFPLPFVRASANRIVVLLDTLQRLRECIDGQGNRTAEGHRLIQDYFSGDNAWFSPSSLTEEHDFRREMTFPDSESPGGEVFCPWHGKERASVLRIHFKWPVGAKDRLLVPYVGPKLTKR